MNWDAERAAKLRPVVDELELEPHPVSGEIELDDLDSIKYRRLDEETLQSRLDAAQFNLAPIYVWCESDEHGDTGPGWKLTELRALKDVEDGTTWYNSVAEANDAANTHSIAVPSTAPAQQPAQAQADDGGDDSDDDGYWAAYDQTPGPSKNPSPKPPANAAAPETTSSNRDRSRSELEYFARYGAEVQPALDAHDPDEDHPELGQSTLNGTTQRVLSTQPQTRQQPQPSSQEDNRSAWEKALHPYARTTDAHDSAFATSTDLPSTHDLDITAPRPISPTTSHSSVEHLESKAAEMSRERNNSHVENAVKQHIATEIKSLWRLANGAGLDREEFERVISLEVQCIGMMDRDE